jgi:hypothetical protein
MSRPEASIAESSAFTSAGCRKLQQWTREVNGGRGPAEECFRAKVPVSRTNALGGAELA